jgi:hypothetical protein
MYIFIQNKILSDKITYTAQVFNYYFPRVPQECRCRFQIGQLHWGTHFQGFSRVIFGTASIMLF